MFGCERAATAFASRSNRCERVRIGGDGLRQDLDRDVPIELSVPCAVHLSHPARAQRRDDFVGAETGSAGKRHGSAGQIQRGRDGDEVGAGNRDRTGDIQLGNWRLPLNYARIEPDLNEEPPPPPNPRVLRQVEDPAEENGHLSAGVGFAGQYSGGAVLQPAGIPRAARSSIQAAANASAETSSKTVPEAGGGA